MKSRSGVASGGEQADNEEDMREEDTNHEMDAYNRELRNVLDLLLTTRLHQKKVNDIRMSLNKMKQIFERNERRNGRKKSWINNEDIGRTSFTRFGDDLSELILSYLPLEDKFRFRCLSTRIQTFILNKQYFLKLTEEDNISGSVVKRLDRFGHRSEIKFDIFNSCLHEFGNNLTDIEIGFAVNCPLLYAIADNCPHLKRLDIKLSDDITDKAIEYFGRKCGQNIRYLSIGNRSEKQDKCWALLLTFTPNLISLSVKQIDIRFLLKSDSEILLPKLRTIEFDYYSNEVMIEMQNKYRHQLKSLIIGEYLFNQFSAMNSLRMIFGFESLRGLKSLQCKTFWRSTTAEDNQRLCQAFSRIAKFCPELRRLDFWFPSHFEVDPEYKPLSMFRTFAQLNELKLVLDKYYSNLDSLADLRLLPQMKRLSISYHSLSDKHFRDISRCLPRLESLSVDTTKVLGNSSLRHISKIYGLKSLDIHCHPKYAQPKFSDRGFKKLMDNCPKVKAVLRHTYETRNGMSYETNSEKIKFFESDANQWSRIEFQYKFYTNEIRRYRNLLFDCPKNLLIIMNDD